MSTSLITLVTTFLITSKSVQENYYIMSRIFCEYYSVLLTYLYGTQTVSTVRTNADTDTGYAKTHQTAFASQFATPTSFSYSTVQLPRSITEAPKTNFLKDSRKRRVKVTNSIYYKTFT